MDPGATGLNNGVERGRRNFSGEWGSDKNIMIPMVQWS